MKITTTLPLVLTFLTLSCAFAIPPDADPNVRDLQVLAKWFEGEFDNDDQLWVEARSDWWGKADEKHQQIHAIHKRIKADSIGKYVLYIEEYIDNDRAKVGRQRIVTFESLVDKPGIAMKLYFLKDAEKFLINSETHKEAIINITEDNLFGIDGCDVIFQRNGEQYHGNMVDRACQFGEGAKKRYSVHDIVLSENQYWRVDRTFLVSNDSFHAGHPNTEPHKMVRVQYYDCQVSFHEKAYYIPSEKDKHYKGIRIHDQGGTAYFENPIDGKKYYLQLRDKEYPFYELADADFLFLRLKEEGQQASVALAFAESNAETVGFQLGWAMALCKCEK